MSSLMNLEIDRVGPGPRTIPSKADPLFLFFQRTAVRIFHALVLWRFHNLFLLLERCAGVV